MAIYRMTTNELEPLAEVTFAGVNVSERGDLQRLLKRKIAIIAPDVLIISEEFSDWEDSRRRIDLLGIDPAANFSSSINALSSRAIDSETTRTRVSGARRSHLSSTLAIACLPSDASPFVSAELKLLS